MSRQLLEGTSHINWSRESSGLDQAWVYIPKNASMKIMLIDYLNPSEIMQNPENKEEVNSYHSKEIWCKETTNNM